MELGTSQCQAVTKKNAPAFTRDGRLEGGASMKSQVFVKPLRLFVARISRSMANRTSQRRLARAMTAWLCR